MTPGGSKGKPAVQKRFGVEVIDNQFFIDKESVTSVFIHLNTDVIPLIGFQQMVTVGIFFQDGGSVTFIGNGQRVACVAAEASGGIVITSITQIIALHPIALCKAASALLVAS